DVALEGRSVGALERAHHDPPDVTAVDLALADAAEAVARVGHAAGSGARSWATDSAAGRSNGICGLRPSALASAAAMSSRNSGWGRSGRLLNSGWAWVPTQNGWPASSMNSTRRSSGDTPEHHSPPSSSRVR